MGTNYRIIYVYICTLLLSSCNIIKVFKEAPPKPQVYDLHDHSKYSLLNCLLEMKDEAFCGHCDLIKMNYNVYECEDTCCLIALCKTKVAENHNLIDVIFYVSPFKTFICYCFYISDDERIEKKWPCGHLSLYRYKIRENSPVFYNRKNKSDSQFVEILSEMYVLPLLSNDWSKR